MSRSRREVLISGGVIGAGLVGADFSILDALAGPPPPKRVSLATLSMTDPLLETYRDAVKIMQAKPASDKFNWTNLCYIHGNETDYHFCPHGDWYFLPWHRAYVVTYEKAIRNLTGNNDFAFPYWDWFANPKLPDQFTAPTVNGQANPLYVAARTWPANTPMPSTIVGPSVQTAVMAATPFESFGTTRNPAQNSLDQSWVPEGGGFQGELEKTPHNQIHNNIGGFMPYSNSPMDPIFFMHHANIDRIWAVWNHNGNANSSDPLWTGMTFENNFLNPDGTSWSPKVSDLYVPENLGYTYGLGIPLLAAKNLVLEENKFIQLMKYLKNPGGPVEGLRVFEAATATIAATHLVLPVRVESSLVESVRRAKRPPQGANIHLLQETRAANTRVLALISNVSATKPRNAEYRVFLNAKTPSPETPVSDPHYVGSFAIFDHSMTRGRHKMPSFSIDLTDAVQRVGEGGDLNVQIVPVPIRKGESAGTVTAEKVQIAFLTP